MSEPVAPTLLIIDDTPTNLGVMTPWFEQHGFEVSIAQDGEDGIARALRVCPDLILLDVMMPGIDGFETCRRLKAHERTRNIPVIFMTSLNDTASKLAGFEAGGVDYVTKPIQIVEVMARVNTHLTLAGFQRQMMARNSALQDELALRKQAESELLRANANLSKTLTVLQSTQQELIRTAKLAGLGAVVAGVAHELNTPIGNALLTSGTLHESALRIADLFADDKLKKAELGKFLKAVEQGSDLVGRNLARAGTLIEHFKHLSVDQTNDRRRRFMLKDVVCQVIGHFQQQLDQFGHRVMVELAADIAMESYPGVLDVVLSHFFSNSLLHGFEAINRGGIIKIEAIIHQPDWVRLRFSDNGHGIANERLGKIFDPFYTTKLGRGSSGIGLYVSYNLCTAILGAQISVTSTFGEGTEFVLDLPILAPEKLNLIRTHGTPGTHGTQGS